jgi:hypothetical protein
VGFVMKIRVCLGIAFLGFLSLGTSAQAGTVCTLTVALQANGGGSTNHPSAGSCSFSDTFNRGGSSSEASTTVTMTNDKVSVTVTGTNNTDSNVSGGINSTNVFATLPGAQVFFGNPTGTINGVEYNLSSVNLLLTDKANLSITGDTSSPTSGSLSLSSSINGFFFRPLFGSQTATTPVSSSGATVDPLTGSLHINTPGQGQNFGGVIEIHNLPNINTFNGIDFNLDVSFTDILNTITGANNATVHIDDPITLALEDANGQIIPGVTFVTDDGFVFNSGEQTATPIPATLPLFATGLGAMGLLGWRRKRKAQAGLPN